jgi:hypothetical protein
MANMPDVDWIILMKSGFVILFAPMLSGKRNITASSTTGAMHRRPYLNAPKRRSTLEVFVAARIWASFCNPQTLADYLVELLMGMAPP